MEKEDFRIVEFDGGFRIEKKRYEQVWAPSLLRPFHHEKREHWFLVDKRGYITWRMIGGWAYAEAEKPHKTLESAQRKIDILIKGKIIHTS